MQLKWLFSHWSDTLETVWYLKLGDNTFVIEWFAGINCIILWSQISFYRDASAER